MASDIKLENESVVIEGLFIQAKGTDFMLDNEARRNSYQSPGKGPTVKPPAGSVELRRALVHGLGDQLVVNYARDYRAGVLIQGKVRLEELHGVSQNAVVCKTTDLILDSDERRSEGHKGNNEQRRALVHNVGDKLTVNYALDYPGGVEIQGKVEMPGLANIGTLQVKQVLYVDSRTAADTKGFSPRVALFHEKEDQLAINYAGSYSGGVKVDGQVRVQELHGHTMNAVVCKTTDLILDSDERRSEGHKGKGEMRRALVHDVGDQLTINYGSDYPAGVKLQGFVRIPEKLVVGDSYHGVRITDDTIILRTTQAPPVTDGPRTDGRTDYKGVRLLPANLLAEELKVAAGNGRPVVQGPGPLIPQLKKVYQIDLVEQLYALQAEIESLRAEVARMKAKV